MIPNDAIWQKIDEHIQHDAPGTRAFRDRLACENRWSLEFVDRAIREYQRFLYLAATIGHPVSPSETVDEVWHLHLIHTHSYWTVLCGDVLKRPLHHHPSRGGTAEKVKLENWYRNTLESYRRIFAEEPPPEIWSSLDGGEKTQVVHVDANRFWIIPKLPVPSVRPIIRRSLTRAARYCEQLGPQLLVFLIFLTVGGCQWAAQANIFNWEGPTFLAFYAVISTVALSVSATFRHLTRTPSDARMDTELPLDAYSIAYLTGDVEAVVNGAVVSLANRGLIEIESKSIPTVRHTEKRNPTQLPSLEAIVARASNQPEGVTIKELRQKIKAGLQPRHQKLVESGFLPTTSQAAFSVGVSMFIVTVLLIIGVIKAGVGVWRDRPILFLICEMLVVAFAGYAISLVGRRRTIRGDLAVARLKQIHSSYRRLEGQDVDWDQTPSILPLAVGLFGLTCLEQTPYASLRHRLNPVTSSDNGGTGCGSTGCGGGGCGGGCGGGGCGGCSG